MQQKEWRRLTKPRKYLVPIVYVLGSLALALSPNIEARADAPPALPAIDLGASIPSDYEFCATINNYDPANTYTLISRDSSGASGFIWHIFGQVKACGIQLPPGESAQFDLVASRDGFTDSVVRLSGRSLANSPIQITVINYERTADGFILEITPRRFVDEVWTLYVSAGQVRLQDPTHLEVTGLTPGQTVSGSISAALPNYYNALLDFSGSALTDEEVRQRAEANAKELSERERLAAEATTKAYLERIQAERTKASEEAKAKAAEVRNADLAAISSLVESPESTSLSKIQKLTPDQMSLITIEAFRQLPLRVFAGLSAQQAAGLTPAQVKSLTIPKLRKLSPTAIGSLKPEALGSLNVAKLKSLTKAQVAKIWLAQLLQLDADQRTALRR